MCLFKSDKDWIVMMNIHLNSLIHPEDKRTLNALKNIPALPKLMEKVFQYGYDEISWSENVTMNLRLSETQMPKIYNRLPPICERLGIPVPELYLQSSYMPNSWTSGQTKPYIVVTLGLINRLTLEELDAVLAHECGHIICHHVLYQTLASAIFEFSDSMADSLIGAIGTTAMKPIRQALIAWIRASELSADRFACIISTPETLARALARASFIPRYIVNDMDINAWAEQGKDYEALKSGTAWNKIIHWMANTDVDHPYAPVRVYEAMLWNKTEICHKLKSDAFVIAYDKRVEVTQNEKNPNPENLASKECESTGNSQDYVDKGKAILKNVNISSLFKK